MDIMDIMDKITIKYNDDEIEIYVYSAPTDYISKMIKYNNNFFK